MAAPRRIRKEEPLIGEYTSYENVATGDAIYYTRLSYRIERDWVLNEKGTPENMGVKDYTF